VLAAGAAEHLQRALLHVLHHLLLAAQLAGESRQNLLAIYSDMHKDAYGCRPSGSSSMNAFTYMSTEELISDIEYFGKLIDADRVMALLGLWASSVTLGVLPLVEAANVLLFSTSSSDDIPAANKRGLLFNFQPLNAAWAVAIARLAVRRNYREIALAGPNNDFATTLVASFRRSFEEAGGRVVNEPFFYNTTQPSFRAEVDRLLRGNPPAVFIPGYVADFTAVYRDIYRAGYRGRVFTIPFAVGPQFKTAVGAAADGIMHGFPVPPVGSPAYDAFLRFMGRTPNGEVQLPFGSAGYDQINLLLLAIAAANSTDVDAVKAMIPRVANGPGERVTTVAEGLAALRAGKTLNYDGASSSVEFKPDGSLYQPA
jgi:branched-chain amino acid transport system substrate-binding protein